LDGGRDRAEAVGKRPETLWGDPSDFGLECGEGFRDVSCENGEGLSFCLSDEGELLCELSFEEGEEGLEVPDLRGGTWRRCQHATAS